ncbi:MAG: hypothetical protein GY822_27570 [Deltaproteobacteria bacterium]|nr:hypothetical protein [Deltaproteobacteria bacterium]
MTRFSPTARFFTPPILLLLGCVAGYAATRSSAFSVDEPRLVSARLTTSFETNRSKNSSKQADTAGPTSADGKAIAPDEIEAQVAIRKIAPEAEQKLFQKSDGGIQESLDDNSSFEREYTPSARSKSLLRVARRVGASPVNLQVPCRIENESGDCDVYALDRYFTALDRVDSAADDVNPHADAGQANESTDNDVRMVTLGNSLIASDRITNISRARFQQRFGKGGGGFFLVDRQADYGGRARTGYANRSWQVYNFSQGDRGRYPHGLPGVHHVSTRRGARTTWRIKGDTEGRLFWLDHKRAPSMDLYADNNLLLHIEPSSEGAFGSRRGALADTSFAIPEGTKKLRLTVNGRGAVVEGLSLNAPRKGAHFDAFGVVAADARVWLGADETLFNEGMRHRDPHLVLLMLGGNEVRRVAWGKYGYRTVRSKAEKFIARIRKATPKSDCLVVGPLHAVRGKNHRTPFATRPQLARVNQIYQDVALEKGCAFFDTYRSMGGRRALKRFYDNGLLHEDLVHPRGKGLDLLGEFVFQALMKNWVETPANPNAFQEEVPAPTESADEAAPEKKSDAGAASTLQENIP